MNSHPKRPYDASRTMLTAGACLAALLMSTISRADDTYIDSSVAIVELQKLALADKSARVILQTLDGDTIAVFARVGFSTISSKTRVIFNPHFTKRPGAEKTLVEEYWEEGLGRPLTQSDEDRDLAKKLKVVRVARLETQGKAMAWGSDRYLVKSIDELDMTGPVKPVAMTVKAEELLHDDPWTGDEQDEPSNWFIVYTIKGFSEPFRYRIHYVDNPNGAPIDSVTVNPAAWRCDRNGNHQWGILFTMRQGRNRPYVGFFELDEYGYPVEAKFAGAAILDEELSRRLSPHHRWALWVKNHEFESPADAWNACPGTIGNRSGFGQILYELLESTQNPDIRLQVLGVIQASHIVEKRMVSLIERSLDSPYEDEVATAERILHRHAQEQAREH